MLIKSKKLKTILIIVAVLIVISYVPMMIDDAVVRHYIRNNVEKGYGCWIVGSNLTIYNLMPAREYIFMVGAEGTLEIIVSLGKVVSAQELSKIPHMWGGFDLRFGPDRWK